MAAGAEHPQAGDGPPEAPPPAAKASVARVVSAWAALAAMVAIEGWVLLPSRSTGSVLATAVVAIVGILVLARIRERPFPRGAAAAGSAALGLVCSLLISAHLLAVLSRPMRVGLAAFEYDFRFYALGLVGVLILIQGVRCLASVRGLLAGEGPGRRRALSATWILLAVNLPLMPIQDFAVAFSGGAAANALLLWIARGR